MEESFYTIVASIAVVMLILVLTYIGIVMVYYKGKTSYPPVAATCPEYWKVGEEGKCYIPSTGEKNAGSLYAADATPISNIPGYGSTSNGNYINFQDAGWARSGKTQICAQSQWANSKQIVWDGVTNFNGC